MQMESLLVPPQITPKSQILPVFCFYYFYKLFHGKELTVISPKLKYYGNRHETNAAHPPAGWPGQE